MEKLIGRYSYLLGLALTVVAFAWRALNAFGFRESVMTVNYMTVYKGAVLLLLVAVATTGCAWVQAQKT